MYQAAAPHSNSDDGQPVVDVSGVLAGLHLFPDGPFTSGTLGDSMPTLPPLSQRALDDILAGRVQEWPAGTQQQQQQQLPASQQPKFTNLAQAAEAIGLTQPGAAIAALQAQLLLPGIHGAPQQMLPVQPLQALQQAQQQQQQQQLVALVVQQHAAQAQHQALHHQQQALQHQAAQAAQATQAAHQALQQAQAQQQAIEQQQHVQQQLAALVAHQQQASLQTATAALIDAGSAQQSLHMSRAGSEAAPHMSSVPGGSRLVSTLPVHPQPEQQAGMVDLMGCASSAVSLMHRSDSAAVLLPRSSSAASSAAAAAYAAVQQLGGGGATGSSGPAAAAALMAPSRSVQQAPAPPAAVVTALPATTLPQLPQLALHPQQQQQEQQVAVQAAGTAVAAGQRQAGAMVVDSPQEGGALSAQIAATQQLVAAAAAQQQQLLLASASARNSGSTPPAAAAAAHAVLAAQSILSPAQPPANSMLELTAGSLPGATTQPQHLHQLHVEAGLAGTFPAPLAKVVSGMGSSIVHFADDPPDGGLPCRPSHKRERSLRSANPELADPGTAPTDKQAKGEGWAVQDQEDHAGGAPTSFMELLQGFPNGGLGGLGARDGLDDVSSLLLPTPSPAGAAAAAEAGAGDPVPTSMASATIPACPALTECSQHASGCQVRQHLTG